MPLVDQTIYQSLSSLWQQDTLKEGSSKTVTKRAREEHKTGPIHPAPEELSHKKHKLASLLPVAQGSAGESLQRPVTDLIELMLCFLWFGGVVTWNGFDARLTELARHVCVAEDSTTEH